MRENAPERDENAANATDGARVDPRPDDAPAPVEDTAQDDAGATPAQAAAGVAETDDGREDDR